MKRKRNGPRKAIVQRIYTLTMRCTEARARAKQGADVGAAVRRDFYSVVEDELVELLKDVCTTDDLEHHQGALDLIEDTMKVLEEVT